VRALPSSSARRPLPPPFDPPPTHEASGILPLRQRPIHSVSARSQIRRTQTLAPATALPLAPAGRQATAMRRLLEEGAMALPVAPEGNASSVGAGSPGPMWWVSECHGVWYSLAVILPSLAFVGFLAWQARWSFRRISYGRSHVVVVAYYALLWAVAILNLLWCFLQVRILFLCSDWPVTELPA
jgi:hypothetical protein